ncbi:MAG: hypothetical protein E6G60_05700 [Actinobacteria bacterium]|nr:MAG: hypothetical protein E6G60_05700 [Actinomycetota bacterium]
MAAKNDDADTEARLGALGDALHDAGFRRAVIGNGDGQLPDTPTPRTTVSSFRRQLVLALMTSSGRVPAGRVDDGLLEPAPRSPFGKRLNIARVDAAFAKVWKDRSVVVVEASDLVRQAFAASFTTEGHRGAILRAALHRSDRLVGRLLTHVDLGRDAVVVVGPAPSPDVPALTVLGVHAPGVAPGLLQSATTRRAGFVALIDVAPTILDLVGVKRPPAMDGLPVYVGETGISAREREDLFTRENDAAQFRDDRADEVALALVVFAAALVALTLFALAQDRRRRARSLLTYLPLAVLGFVPAVFIARFFRLDDAGVVAYWAVVVALAAGLGALYRRAGRREWLDSLLVALLAPVAFLGLDVIFGSGQIFNAALGSSATIARPFTGLSNAAYGAFAVSALLGAVLLARRVGGRRGLWWAGGVLAFAPVIDGAPFLGSDIAGTVSMLLAFSFTMVLLSGRRIGRRTIGGCVLGSVFGLACFAAVDLARASDRRTHLARFVARIDERGISSSLTVFRRELSDNFGSATSGHWWLLIPVAVVLAWWLVRRTPGRLEGVRAAIPQWPAAAVGFTILAIAGYFLYDSGMAVVGSMLGVVVPAVVWLVVTPNYAMRPDNDARVASGDGDGDRRNAADTTTSTVGALR